MENLFYSQHINETSISLDEQEAVHCSLVLRKKVGDIIYVVDGKGNLHKCGIDEIGKRTVNCTILSSEFSEPMAQLTLAVSPTKNRDRLEWLVEKVVEIGVKKVIFLATDRTERTRINMERIVKKAIGAMKQSLRMYLPEFVEMSLKEALALESDNKLIAHCLKHSKDVLARDLTSLSDVFILIGPEGDFTPVEVEAAIAAGFKTLDLGSARLRTETAAIAAAVLANA